MPRPPAPSLAVQRCVLALNGGSSSIRFAVHQVMPPYQRRVHGNIARVGQRDAELVISDSGGTTRTERIRAPDHRVAVTALLTQLEIHQAFASIVAVGHRIVHGMAHARPERVTASLLTELRQLTPFDPEHLPRELAMIDVVRRRHADLPQVACFDTAFHRTMPGVATRLALPRHFAKEGLRRYGFHGLSYAYLIEELRRVSPTAARGRVILAHLGNGASLAAVHRGLSVDTSMGFTPSGGLVMGTRSGDIDPGLVTYLTRAQHVSPARFRTIVNEESGLLGISETSADMRDLLGRESSDPRAAEAVELFCYQVRKWIGAYAAVLGGVDALVFSGGIGEHAALVRARICAPLAFLGIVVVPRRNSAHAPLISTDAARVQVRVIPSNEELMIARDVIRTLGLDAARPRSPRA